MAADYSMDNTSGVMNLGRGYYLAVAQDSYRFYVSIDPSYNQANYNFRVSVHWERGYYDWVFIESKNFFMSMSSAAAHTTFDNYALSGGRERYRFTFEAMDTKGNVVKTNYLFVYR